MEVEVFAAEAGIPTLRLVGLPSASVKEAEQRVRAAIESTFGSWQQRKMIANLAPGALRKEGTHLDLALAVAVLAATERLPAERLEGWLLIGELALDGSLRAVRGALAAAIRAKKDRFRGVVCPSSNAGEAGLVEGVKVVAVPTLKACVEFLEGRFEPEAHTTEALRATPSEADLAEVRGQSQAKIALEIAAAGGHNLLLSGSPGSGKTMLARRLPGILPAMSHEESLEVTQIHSVAGLLIDRPTLIAARPFRSPHHNASLASLVGGGSGLARPGEVSLAHHGVLFLDEISLFRRDALEALRGPLEDGSVRIARSAGLVEYPCRFSLVAAMNPCPCGSLGDARVDCRCTPLQLHHYASRLSGPLMDRFDLQVAVSRVPAQDLMAVPEGESSTRIRARVAAARAIQTERFSSPLDTNSSVSRGRLGPHLHLDRSTNGFLAQAIDGVPLSGRGLDRLLRIGRTIADLEAADRVTMEHVTQALGFRMLRLQGSAA